MAMTLQELHRLCDEACPTGWNMSVSIRRVRDPSRYGLNYDSFTFEVENDSGESLKVSRKTEVEFVEAMTNFRDRVRPAHNAATTAARSRLPAASP